MFENDGIYTVYIDSDVWPDIDSHPNLRKMDLEYPKKSYELWIGSLNKSIRKIALINDADA